jgi:SAM-dependent methyltransferase
MPQVRVTGIPPWVDRERFLGPGPWTNDVAELSRLEAADLGARLRGIAIAGHTLEVQIRPPLKRAMVRAARTEDARRRRHTTPGFTRTGTRLDPQGKMSLTPEILALRLGERARGKTVVDAMCGCGGNAIGFARAGCKVIAMDIDPGRLEMARHNAGIYGVERQITFRLGDARDLSVDGDLLFLDPPWEAMTLVSQFAQRPVWIKAPPSFEIPAGFNAEAWFGEAPGDRQRIKFLLLTAAA